MSGRHVRVERNRIGPLRAQQQAGRASALFVAQCVALRVVLSRPPIRRPPLDDAHPEQVSEDVLAVRRAQVAPHQPRHVPKREIADERTSA